MREHHENCHHHRRLGTPEDIAQAMLYLADAPFLTGQTLPLNGGFVIT